MIVGPEAVKDPEVVEGPDIEGLKEASLDTGPGELIKGPERSVEMPEEASDSLGPERRVEAIPLRLPPEMLEEICDVL